MAIRCFENTACSEDFSFLSKDKFAFSVLLRILRGKCALTLLGDKRLVICHSAIPYPVWIWLPDDADEKEMENAYLLTKKHLGIEKNRFNLKYPLAEYFIRRAKEDGISLQIQTNMLAYSCPAPIAPQKEVGGYLERATEQDLACVVDFLRLFFKEAGLLADIASDEAYIEKAQKNIEQGFFFWNCDGVRVACGGIHTMEDQCSIHAIYTDEQHRRHGYASHLVYALAEQILSIRKTPTLYTDADYVASNTCYTNIGFVCHGGLCTLGEAR